jgi:hypothetical protein
MCSIAITENPYSQSKSAEINDKRRTGADAYSGAAREDSCLGLGFLDRKGKASRAAGGRCGFNIESGKPFVHAIYACSMGASACACFPAPHGTTTPPYAAHGPRVRCTQPAACALCAKGAFPARMERPCRRLVAPTHPLAYDPVMSGPHWQSSGLSSISEKQIRLRSAM